MKNFKRISILLLIMFILITPNIYATNITRMNNTTGENIDALTDNTLTTIIEGSSSNESEPDFSTSTSTSVPYIQHEDVGLSTSDIINIILIAVCVVQILLAIAILIRLR